MLRSEEGNKLTVDIQKLNQHQKAIEKQVLVAWSEQKFLALIGSSEAISTHRDLEKKRVAECKKIKQTLGAVQLLAEAFKKGIGDYEEGEVIEIGKYKKQVEELEESVEKFKEENENIYSSLMHREQNLTEEIEGLKHKVKEWCKKSTVSACPKPVPKKTASIISDSDQNECSVFSQFLFQHGGHSGGWDDPDHQLYLKLKNRHKTLPDFIDDILIQLPGKTELDVAEHDRWYQQYSKKLEAHKKAIENWKKKKAEQNMVVSKKNAVEAGHEDMREKKQWAQWNKGRLDKLQAVLEWKKLQQQQKDIEEEEKLILEELRKKAKTVHKCEQERKKQMVEQYKREKQKQQDEDYRQKQMKEMERKKENVAKAMDLIPLFREKDKRILEEKERRKLKAEEVEKEKRQRLECLRKKAEVLASRDPTRVLSSTQCFLERKKQLAERDTGDTVYIHLRSMPHKAVPTWRKGL